MDNKYKTGYTTIIARPNVGKSTLLNLLIGQKIAITTNTAQTTRVNIKGILTNKTSQIIFVDTPGVHKPKNELGEFLSSQTLSAIKDTDLIIFLVDCNTPAGAGDKWIYDNIIVDAQKAKTPILLVLNKIDECDDRKKNLNSYLEMFGHAKDEISDKNINFMPEYVEISAKTGENVDILIKKIEKYMPQGAKLYPGDEITDQSMREIASEIVREKIILNTKDEIPHSVAVLVNKYEEKPNIDRISATIYVSSDSQKGILIGAKGSMLKKIGTQSRLELEKIIEKKIYLELFVKVQKNWQKDKKAMKMLGLSEK